MLDAIPYDALLAVHLLAVAAFLAGLLLTATMLPGLMRTPLSDKGKADLARLRAIDRVMTSPALVLLWLCGIGMAIDVGWYLTGWFRMKVACVVVLSILHLNNVRRIRALGRGEAVRPAGYRVLWLILALVVAIGTLVIGKPF
jgi:protoporphyrinogen IX oxidase